MFDPADLPRPITSEGSAGDLANIHAAVTVASMGASTDPGFGLLCNVQPNGAYYYLGFGPDGYYGIGYYDGESSRLLTNENNDWIISAAIEKYSDPYQLEADWIQADVRLPSEIGDFTSRLARARR